MRSGGPRRWGRCHDGRRPNPEPSGGAARARGQGGRAAGGADRARVRGSAAPVGAGVLGAARGALSLRRHDNTGPDVKRATSMPGGVVIAALFVREGGCYYGLPEVDPWPASRDARLYGGPWPVVAHPPCERWGRYWYGGPGRLKAGLPRREKGADGGCFAAALAAVRRWGGVLEHPAASAAWAAFGLARPPREGWGVGDCLDGPRGWTCQVEQGHYGHRARKATWLYAVGCELPSLQWGASAATARLDELKRRADTGRLFDARLERLSKAERAATPERFRDLLLSMVRQ